MSLHQQWRATLFVIIIRQAALVLVLSSGLWGQQPQFNFDRFDQQDGLSQSTVYDILCDSRGLMWFATQDGLNRFDGYRFKTYRESSGDSTSLGNGWVEALYEDEEGHIWVGLRSGGLNRYDRYKDQFIRYPVKVGDSTALNADRLFRLCGDGEGGLWLGTIGGGLNHFNPATGLFKAYKHDPQNPGSISNNNIFSLYLSPEKVLWVGTYSGLNRWDPKSKSFDRFFPLPDNPRASDNRIRAIKEDGKGNMWVATQGGLYRLDRYSGEFHKMGLGGEGDFNLVSNLLMDLMIDKKDRLWIATYDAGLQYFDLESGESELLTHNIADNRSISSDGIRSLYEDVQGNFWVGTSGGGISKYSPIKQKFLHLRHDLADENSLGGNKIFTLLADDEGFLWAGTMAKGLSLSRIPEDATSFAFKHFTDAHPQKNKRLLGKTISGIAKDDDGHVWLATLKGLNKIVFSNPEDPIESDYSIRTDFGEPGNQVVYPRCSRIAFSSDGLLIVGTYKGLSLYDPSSDRFVNYLANADDSLALKNNTIMSILVDSSGRNWIGTMAGIQLMKIEYDSLQQPEATFHQLPIAGKRPDALDQNLISAIYPFREDMIAIGTHDAGLFLYETQKKIVYRYDDRADLPGLAVNGVLSDHADKLWISTNRGLAHLDPREYAAKVYDVDDGLQNNEFNAGAYTKAENGMLFFGGIDGINAFHPEKLPYNPVPPKVLITGLKRLDEDLSLETQIAEVNQVELGPDENFLTIEFAALDYTAPAKNSYKYRLDGVDDNWIMPRNRRHATYTNLDPGSYRFRVKASNNDGVWNNAETRLTIVIHPPFWGTWWFRGLLGVALFAALSFGIYYWVRSEQISRERLEKKVNERTLQLVREKEKVQQINEELEQLSLVASGTSNAVLIVDENGMVEWVNKAFTDLFGFSLEDLHGLGKDTIESLKPHPELAQVLKQLREEKRPMVFEGSVPTRDRRQIWVSSSLTPVLDQLSGKIKKIIVIDTDITALKEAQESSEAAHRELEERVRMRTSELSEAVGMLNQQIRERKDAERELASEKERLAVTLGSIADGVITTDMYGNVVLVNPAAEQLLGCSRFELIGRPIETVFLTLDEDDRKILTNPVTQVLQKGKVFNPVAPSILMVGEEQDCLINTSSAPIRDYTGKMIGAVLIFQDISEKRRLEEERLKASKLESLSILAEGLAHNFNNYLTGIVGNTAFAQKQVEKGSDLEGMLNTIEVNCFKAASLTQQLQTFAQNNKPLKALGSLRKLLTESVDLFMSGAQARCELTIADDLWNNEMDSGQINQVLHNLVINAKQAMPNGGVLRIIAENTMIEGHPYLADGPYIRVVSKDNGVGIPAKNLKKIFDPHFTTKAKGSGLGLATSQTIIRNHDGEITVESKEGIGTTFTILLPATDKKMATPGTHETLSKGSGHILVMEDEADIRKLLKEMLSDFGYQVTTAERGEEALAYFQRANQEANPFHAVIMDLTVPGGMGGKEMMVRLREIEPRVKAILMSGYSQSRLMGEYSEIGFNGIITKPFDVETVNRVLKSVLSENGDLISVNGESYIYSEKVNGDGANGSIQTSEEL